MLPDKKSTYTNAEIKIGNHSITEVDGRYNAGYNDCLDEIKTKFKTMGKEK